jgi:O-methyltransferase
MDINPVSRWYSEDFVRTTGGFFLPGDPVERKITEFHACDLVRRDMLILFLRTILERKIPGDLAELGVYQGHTARLFHHYLPERPLHLFDTFSGFDEADMTSEAKVTGLKVAAEFADTSVEMVLKRIAPRQPENVVVHQGFFPGTIPSGWEEKQFAFVHVDADLYEPILAALRYFYPKVPAGGMIVVHDYNAWPGSRRAVTEFLADKKEPAIPLPDKSGSALIVKQ